MTIASPAVAQISNAQRAKEREAKKACLAGENNYKQGIEVLAELYAETNEPTYIYNQGRCYQQNNQPELALGRFQEYLRREPKMTPKEKATLEIYMRECEALVAKMQPPPTTGPTSPPIKIEVPQEPTLTQTLASPPLEPSTRSGRGLRITGVTMATIGLVTLGGAVTLNWLQRKEEKSFKDGATKDGATWSNKANQYKTLSQIGYGVGGATLATGITLYIIGWRSEKTEEPSLALIPSIFPNEATLSLRGAF